MSRDESFRAIEAILMVAQEPVDPHLLAQLLEVPPDRIDEICQALADDYREAERGFELVKVAGGYRYQSHADLAPYLERFVLEGQTARLSAAALETLAIVAYKQPLSRAQVAAIRGVNVDGVMRTLQHRGYIEEVARDSGPGQAVLFGTTTEFLARMGLDSLDDLPPIADLFPSTEVMEALERGLRAEPDEVGDEQSGAGLGGAGVGEDLTLEAAEPEPPEATEPESGTDPEDRPAPEPPSWADLEPVDDPPPEPDERPDPPRP